MTLFIGIPLLVCILGLLAFELGRDVRLTTPGIVAFGAGLLVTLWHVAGHTFHL